MILKEVPDDPISGHSSCNTPYNSYVITAIQFLDYLETCGKPRTNPQRHFPFPCFMRVVGLTVLSFHLHPCVVSILLELRF